MEGKSKMKDIYGYSLIALACVCIISVLYIPIYLLVGKVLKIKIPFMRQTGVVFFIGIIFSIIWATILVGGIDINVNKYYLNLVPFTRFFRVYKMGIKKEFTQIFSNIIMFIPVGSLFPVIFRRGRTVKRTMIFGCVFSLTIEFIQYFIGRSADIDDFILNTLGTLLGVFVFKLTFKAFPQSKLW